MHPERPSLNASANNSKESARTPEEWRDVPGPGVEGRNQASTLGRLRWVARTIGSTYHGLIVAGIENQDGYVQVRPYERPHRRFVPVHQLVALAFLGPSPEDLEANHVDAGGTNTAPENLEYVTDRGNIRYAFALGNCERRGKANARARLTVADVRRIRGLLADGRPRQELAESYGITAGQVNCITARRARSHVQ